MHSISSIAIVATDQPRDCAIEPALSRTMEDRIRFRAVELGEARQYVGIFDLLVYAHMRSAVVKTWLGNELLDLLQMFAPVERALLRHDAAEVVLIATRIQGQETMPVQDVRQVNHWLGASRMEGVEGVVNIEDEQELQFC